MPERPAFTGGSACLTNSTIPRRASQGRPLSGLGTIYLLSIVVLEFIIMPQYVYQPLTLMLKADEATQHDDREHEMIGAEFILDDEIGQIMRSRTRRWPSCGARKTIWQTHCRSLRSKTAW